MTKEELENIVLNLWGEEFKDISEVVEIFEPEVECALECSAEYKDHNGAVCVDLDIALDKGDGYMLYFKKVKGIFYNGAVWVLADLDEVPEA